MRYRAPREITPDRDRIAGPGWHDRGVAGPQLVQAGRQLGSVGVLARQLVGEHAQAARLGQGVLLAVEQLAGGADPGIADQTEGSSRGTHGLIGHQGRNPGGFVTRVCLAAKSLALRRGRADVAALRSPCRGDSESTQLSRA